MAKPGVPSAGGEYDPLPEMTFILCQIAGGEDAPTIAPNTKYPDEKTGEVKDQLRVIFDAISYKDEDGDTIDASGSRIWFYGAPSLHEKAKLRGLALAIMPENTTLDVLTPEQAAMEGRAPNLFEDFDTDDLVGKYVWVIGTAGAKGYLKPTGFKRAKVKADAKAAPAKAADKPAKKLAAKAEAIAI